MGETGKGRPAADEETSAVMDRYARFAEEEVAGRSEVYREWAAGIGADEGTAAILARIPAQRRQPPLVFAVTRMLGAGTTGYDGWAAFVRSHAGQVVAECAERSLQTNEPLRCAALLPALSLLEGPVALLELGASGGLCLYPDRFSYRYRISEDVPSSRCEPEKGVLSLDPSDGASDVVLRCRWRGRMPELRLPEIVWRAGIDLQPRDPADAADRAWLTGLVWPGEEGRAERISAALGIAAADPPLLVAGDVADLGLIRSVARRAPEDATLVITTPGVLPYLPRPRREALIAGIGGLDARWITLDQPALHDAWRPPIDETDWPGGFALALDGEVLAAADPLGSAVHWRA